MTGIWRIGAIGTGVLGCLELESLLHGSGWRGRMCVIVSGFA